MKKQALYSALAAVIFLRISTSFFLFTTQFFIQKTQCPPELPCSPLIYSELVENSKFSKEFLAPWYRWDTVHYLKLAQNGYNLEQIETTTWPPLYPFLIRILSNWFSPMAAALLISTLAAFGVFYLLHQIVAEIWEEKTANLVVLVLSVFPTSFFFVSGYTESLFLLFVLSCFKAVRRKKWLLAGLMGCLATLTRYQGFFLALPLLWEAYQFSKEQKHRNWKKNLLHLAVISSLPATFFLNSLYIHNIINAPWPWITKSNYWSTFLKFPGTGIINNTLGLFQSGNLHGKVSQFTDLFLLLLFLFLILRKTPKMPISYKLFSWISLIPSLTMINEWDMMTGVSRFILPIFPGFISLALFIENRKLIPFWLVFSYLAQNILLIFFFNWGWVA